MEKSERPKLSFKEWNRKWRLIREVMLQEGLDCLIILGKSGRRLSRILLRLHLKTPSYACLR